MCKHTFLPTFESLPSRATAFGDVRKITLQPQQNHMLVSSDSINMLPSHMTSWHAGGIHNKCPVYYSCVILRKDVERVSQYQKRARPGAFPLPYQSCKTARLITATILACDRRRSLLKMSRLLKAHVAVHTGAATVFHLCGPGTDCVWIGSASKRCKVPTDHTSDTD